MSKHSQQLLVEHLQALRLELLAQVRRIEAGERYHYLGLCVANYRAISLSYGDVSAAYNPQHAAVKYMIHALPEFQARGRQDYMFPVFFKDAGAREGHERRLAILDGWIADAQRKLRAAVFREAARRAGLAGRTFFMCTGGIADSAEQLTGATRKSGDTYLQCMATLLKYKPLGIDADSAWFGLGDSDKRLRIAILNLCLTDVLRHGE